jgi:hypothetical protein
MSLGSIVNEPPFLISNDMLSIARTTIAPRTPVEIAPPPHQFRDRFDHEPVAERSAAGVVDRKSIARFLADIMGPQLANGTTSPAPRTLLIFIELEPGQARA